MPGVGSACPFQLTDLPSPARPFPEQHLRSHGRSSGQGMEHARNGELSVV